MAKSAKAVLHVERKYLKDNVAKLRKQYPGKFLLIQGPEVHGAFDSYDEGVVAGLQEFPTGDGFLVRSVDEPDDPVFVIPVLALGMPVSC